MLASDVCFRSSPRVTMQKGMHAAGDSSVLTQTHDPPPRTMCQIARLTGASEPRPDAGLVMRSRMHSIHHIMGGGHRLTASTIGAGSWRASVQVSPFGGRLRS